MSYGGFAATTTHENDSACAGALLYPKASLGEEAELFWRGIARVRMWSGMRSRHNTLSPPPPAGSTRRNISCCERPTSDGRGDQRGYSLSLLLRVGCA
jgi:hypothetical protein